MTTYNVGYFVGSLATASINRLLAKALLRLAPPELHFKEISFKELPEFLRNFMAEFHAFIVRVTKVLPKNP